MCECSLILVGERSDSQPCLTAVGREQRCGQAGTQQTRSATVNATQQTGCSFLLDLWSDWTTGTGQYLGGCFTDWWVWVGVSQTGGCGWVSHRLVGVGECPTDWWMWVGVPQTGGWVPHRLVGRWVSGVGGD